MELLDLSNEFTVNISFIKAIEKAENGMARVYIELDDTTKSVVTSIKFELFKSVINSRVLKEKSKGSKAEGYLKQLSKYQTQVIP